MISGPVVDCPYSPNARQRVAPVAPRLVLMTSTPFAAPCRRASRLRAFDDLDRLDVIRVDVVEPAAALPKAGLRSGRQCRRVGDTNTVDHEQRVVRRADAVDSPNAHRWRGPREAARE